MNLENKNQIKQLIKQINPHLINKIKENDELINGFNYIKREKKLIKFVYSNFNIFNIKIPTFITKFDLYSIAQTKKIFNATNILLIHNNKILNKDDSSIDEIIDNDFVVIIENKLYPDNSSYIYLKNKYLHNDIIYLKIVFPDGTKKFYNLSKEITIKEFLNMVIKDNGLFEKNIQFIRNSKIMNINSLQKIKESELIYGANIFCNFSNQVQTIYYFGKVLKGKTKIKNESITINIGTLNCINYLFNELSDYRIVKITIGNIQLNKDSDNCLFLYGIKENFDFTCETENSH